MKTAMETSSHARRSSESSEEVITKEHRALRSVERSQSGAQSVQVSEPLEPTVCTQCGLVSAASGVEAGIKTV